MKEATEKLIQLEEDLFESKTCQNEMLEEMKLLEEKIIRFELEITRLLGLTKEAQRSIYRGNPADKIDTALANVLNSFPERDDLKIMFLRESEGVYRFG